MNNRFTDSVFNPVLDDSIKQLIEQLLVLSFQH